MALERTEIGRGAWLDHDPSWLSKDEADERELGRDAVIASLSLGAPATVDAPPAMAPKAMTPRRDARALWRELFTIFLLFCASPAAAHAGEPDKLALRAGWAYGLGGELELRPGHVGASLSGGYVPGYGPGGYLGATWGRHAIGSTGPVAEAGGYFGQQSPLRVARTGLGLYAMGGYELAPTSGMSLRVVAGAGLPFVQEPTFPTSEFIARLTVGIAR